jgi:hypothetical protein
MARGRYLLYVCDIIVKTWNFGWKMERIKNCLKFLQHGEGYVYEYIYLQTCTIVWLENLQHIWILW